MLEETACGFSRLELIGVIDPKAIERARRLEVALRHLRAGMEVCEVRLAIRTQFRTSQQQAWRIVDIAADLVGVT